jgi:ABC-type sugar transport system permease subunit
MTEKIKLSDRIKHFFNTLLENIGVFVRSTLRKIERSKVYVSITKAIGLVFYYLFWPLNWVIRHTYGNLSFRKQKVVWAFIFLLPVLAGFLLLFAYPLVMSLIYSFSEVSVNPQGGGLIITFGGYMKDGEMVKDFFFQYKQALLVNPNYPVELVNTIQTTVINLAVITIFSLLLAVMLNGNFKGRGFVRAVFFLPVIFNSEAIDMAVSAAGAVDAVLNSMGTGALSSIFDLRQFLIGANIPAGVVTFLTSITSAIYRTISYSGVQILIFLAAIQSVPIHLYEAAKIEGATGYESFWKITLPMVSPIILTVVVFTVVDSFLRSSITPIITRMYNLQNYGLNAAMSWIYLAASIAILGVVIGILSKVVFYYDEKS